ncbi:bifunctional hydroxymethylpyrimidine kinase/phosphomethylpyrimidine kinase [Heliophilum fasciatum]|uniref:Hydroxymethylpyrimidine/phosphomethylpyrimidine kinase n=1 Tax=Heliophilum fasciatum TaxID=35700 RepID=A0A4R2S1H0_9FIRM|nr:bifunctional hydroxymethylpyrimidine kinase/phosphomethylpyrimidine kinase [Heliophilum fasciatum]MCW2277524.1 hydroxymethylpyrimidine/phosphomethylpyrimidine kinase [Heliophilum fasciatum]TCP65185.1 hydroxymethylpyrimidine/phosphomethylpyrimidine kinase [Heliophilum fasciatum]
MQPVLSIAGSDCSGGAGIQADLKTMCALGVYGMTVITAITAQNTTGVFAVTELTPEMVRQQMQAIFEDIPPAAVKIGMVSSAPIIRTIRETLQAYDAKNIVVDPVMVAKSGHFLLQPEAVDELRHLLAIADVATPNIPEAEALTGLTIEDAAGMEAAARQIAQSGAKHVLVKGGHRCNDANDLLFDGNQIMVLPGKRIDTKNTHGTGCTLSSAIASYLARGATVAEAVSQAKTYITAAITHALPLGQGAGPVGHLIDLYQKGKLTYN